MVFLHTKIYAEGYCGMIGAKFFFVGFREAVFAHFVYEKERNERAGGILGARTLFLRGILVMSLQVEDGVLKKLSADAIKFGLNIG